MKLINKFKKIGLDKVINASCLNISDWVPSYFMNTVSFKELLQAYFFFEDYPSVPKNSDIFKFISNWMVNNGTNRDWISTYYNYFEDQNIKKITLEVIKMHAVNHPLETIYDEWMMLARCLPTSDLFRQKVVIKEVDKTR
jgi:hypothetical protein